MDKTNPRSISQFSKRKSSVDIILHSVLVAVLICFGLTGWTDWSTIESTLLGMVIAAFGGIIIGIFAQRYLAQGQGNREVIFGLVMTAGIGVITIGYLYIIYIKGPMKSIGTVDRAVKQSFIFLEFLVAHISGIKLGEMLYKKNLGEGDISSVTETE